jgi:Adenylate and Guanylate cyclase catalytic domain
LIDIAKFSGNILCGIVGTKRVKFDVWSNDVTFANRMEATGLPDFVHISEETKSFLDDSYYFRDADEVEGHKTYFILGKKKVTVNLLLEQPIINNDTEWNSKSVKNLSTNDIPSIPVVTPTAVALHHSKSLSPSPILNTRKRLASISESVSKLLSPSSASNRANKEQKSFIDQRKGPNPQIIIGLPGVSTDHEHPNKETTAAKDISNTRSNNNCDNYGERLVPYNEKKTILVSSPSLMKDASSSSCGKCDENHESSNINITDLRSYITQSRSDVSPFSRSGSYRQSDRRAHHHRSHSQQSNALSPWYQDQSSDFSIYTPSQTDLGIKASSRKSSKKYFL